MLLMDKAKQRAKQLERIEVERAGVRVLTDMTLPAIGIERARLEVRLARQIELVEDLLRSL